MHEHHSVTPVAGRVMSGRRQRVLAVLVLAIAALWTLSARADTVFSGIDLLETLGCGSHFDFATFPLPPNFFDPGSDPFDGNVPVTGQPLVTAPPGVIFPVDTIVERLADAPVSVCGPALAVPLQIQALSLMSCSPITVTYFGGTNPELWDVEVALSSIFPQPVGSMTIHHDCPEGGTFDATLPVTPKFVFTRQSDGATRTLDVGVDFPFNPFPSGHWEHSDPGFGVMTTPGGFLVDHDGDGIPTVGPVPGSSNFFPGLRHNPCSCTPPPTEPCPPPPLPLNTCAPTYLIYIPGTIPGQRILASPPIGSPFRPDSDGDGFPDVCDNCPFVFNDQKDSDDDGVGDACDPACCGNGVIDPGEECDPPGSPSSACGAFTCRPNCTCCPNATGPEAGHCGDMIDNDCDALVDCTDPDCEPTLCVGGTQDRQDCSTAAAQAACFNGGGECQCPRLRKDPTTIRFGTRPALDVLKSHGRMTIFGPVDVMGSELAWLLTNPLGTIYSAALPPGALTPSATQTQFTYKNPDARLRGGIYKALIKVTSAHTSYGYRVEAYGDMSAATDPSMALQFYIGDQPTSGIHTEVWTRTKFGWKAHAFE